MSGQSGHPGVAPYLTVDGAAKAIVFYSSVFGATELGRHMAEDGRSVMHATLELNGGIVMLADSDAEDGGYPGPDPARRSPVAIGLFFATPAEVDRLHRKALDAGAASVMEPMDAFWNARFAMMTDPFGHRWMLSAPLAARG